MARMVLWIYGALLLVFLVAPLPVVVAMSFSSSQTLRFPPPGVSLRWYQQFFDPNGEWLESIVTSLLVGGATAVVASILGILAAFALVRGGFRGRAALNLFVLSPLLVPSVVIAVGMFVVFVRVGISGTPAGLIAAHSVLAIPLVLVAVSISLRAMDRDLESAAMTLGAGPLLTFRHVTLPLALPGIGAGALFAFVVSWDEVVVAIFLTSPGFQTLPIVMWQQIHSDVTPALAAAAAVILLVTTSILAVVLLLIGRRKERVLP